MQGASMQWRRARATAYVSRLKTQAHRRLRMGNCFAGDHAAALRKSYNKHQ
jgi:hypothetical protein